MKYTRWFPEDTKPGKDMIGVYPTSYVCGPMTHKGYSKWYGAYWGWQQITESAAAAENVDYRGSGLQDKQWRGLTTKDGK